MKRANLGAEQLSANEIESLNKEGAELIISLADFNFGGVGHAVRIY